MPKQADLDLSVDEWCDLFVYARQICKRSMKEKGIIGKRSRRVVELIDKHYAASDAALEKRSA